MLRTKILLSISTLLFSTACYFGLDALTDHAQGRDQLASKRFPHIPPAKPNRISIASERRIGTQSEWAGLFKLVGDRRPALEQPFPVEPGFVSDRPEVVPVGIGTELNTIPVFQDPLSRKDQYQLGAKNEFRGTIAVANPSGSSINFVQNGEIKVKDVKPDKNGKFDTTINPGPGMYSLIAANNDGLLAMRVELIEGDNGDVGKFRAGAIPAKHFTKLRDELKTDDSKEWNLFDTLTKGNSEPTGELAGATFTKVTLDKDGRFVGRITGVQGSRRTKIPLITLYFVQDEERVTSVDVETANGQFTSPPLQEGQLSIVATGDGFAAFSVDVLPFSNAVLPFSNGVNPVSHQVEKQPRVSVHCVPSEDFDAVENIVREHAPELYNAMTGAPAPQFALPQFPPPQFMPPAALPQPPLISPTNLLSVSSLAVALVAVSNNHDEITNINNLDSPPASP